MVSVFYVCRVELCPRAHFFGKNPLENLQQHKNDSPHFMSRTPTLETFCRKKSWVFCCMPPHTSGTLTRFGSFTLTQPPLH
jgi:hypothetical protein